jgi:hypothetical protein
MHAEVRAVHACQIEQVADEPLEPCGLDDDRRGDVLRVERAVLQRPRSRESQ